MLPETFFSNSLKSFSDNLLLPLHLKSPFTSLGAPFNEDKLQSQQL